jgi:competence protein ComEA
LSFLSWLQRNQLPVLGTAIVLLAAGLIADHATRREPPGIEFGYGSGLTDGSPIRVQVAGAVSKPRVYDLQEGDRVVDAIAAAGGPSDDADLDTLNLARRVRDEELLVVPAKPGPASAQSTLAPGARLDINTSTQQQLNALPGIGDVYSRRIVDSRKVDGPYKSTHDLVDRKVIPSGTFDQIRDLVTVGP